MPSTSGATEALAAAFFGLIEPGDEVVVFQPLYDAYMPLVLRAGGVHSRHDPRNFRPRSCERQSLRRNVAAW